MDHSDIERDHVVDRYLMGKLPPEEAARFEEHYLHCRDCLGQLEVAERFQRGIRRAAARDAVRTATVQGLGVLAWLSRLGLARRMGLMATALLAIALLPAGLLYRELTRAGQELDRARAAAADLQARAFEPQINLPIYAFRTERSSPLAGDSPSHVIRLPEDPEWIVLSFELVQPRHPAYRITLLHDRREIWHADGVVPDRRHALVVGLHSTRLEPGSHTARVEGVDDEGARVPIAGFSFGVVR